jgi:hypothetical protein
MLREREHDGALSGYILRALSPDPLQHHTEERATMPKDIYGGMDPTEVPAYTVPIAARYLHMSPATLRTWVAGYSYHKADGSLARQPHVIAPAKRVQGRPYLSFVNLVEAHVLLSIRRVHEISLPKVRRSLRFINRHFDTPHPFVSEQFATDGIDLFLEKFGRLITVDREGQTTIREALEGRLQRIDYVAGFARRLFPVVRSESEPIAKQPKIVVIDPRLSFGRPVVDGTGVPIAEIAERSLSTSVRRPGDGFTVRRLPVRPPARAC